MRSLSIIIRKPRVYFFSKGMALAQEIIGWAILFASFTMAISPRAEMITKDGMSDNSDSQVIEANKDIPSQVNEKLSEVEKNIPESALDNKDSKATKPEENISVPVMKAEEGTSPQAVGVEEDISSPVTEPDKNVASQVNEQVNKTEKNISEGASGSTDDKTTKPEENMPLEEVKTEKKIPQAGVVEKKVPADTKAIKPEEKISSQAVKADQKASPATAVKKNIAKENTNSIPGNIKDIFKSMHPYLTVIEEFNDNLFQFKGDQTVDYITKFYPGMIFKNKSFDDNNNRKPEIYLNGGMESLRYARENQFNDQTPYGRGSFRFNLGRMDFYTYADAKRNRNSTSSLNEEDLKEFIDSWQYNYGQDFKLDLNKVDLELQYNHVEYSYLGAEVKMSNHTRNVLAMRDSFKISPKTKVFVEYAHGWIDYNKNTASNWDYDKYWIGLNGKISPKINGLVKLGYTFTKAKNVKDINGKGANIQLTYKASPRLNYRIDLVNAIGDPNLLSDSVTRSKGASLGLSYLPPWVKKLRLNTDVSYWQRGTDYQTRDNFFQLTCTPEYMLKRWLKISLAYNFEQRMSKTKSHEYTNNTLDLKVTAEF